MKKTKGASAAILAAVDFSASSKKALRVAAKLAGQLGANLTILHVIHDPAHAPGYYNRATKKNAIARLEDGAREMMDEFLTKASKDSDAQPAIAKADVRMVVGTPVGRILEVEEELQPLMVVVGSMGRTGLNRVLIGSKAEQVVRLSSAPVLVVKD